MKKVINSIFGLIFLISSGAIAQEHREFFLRNISQDIISVIHKDILAATCPNETNLKSFISNNTLNKQYRRLECTTQLWSDSNWLNFTRSVFSYDESGNLIEQVNQGLDGINWVDKSRSILSYDELGNLIEIVLQNWDGIKWVNFFRSIPSFDESGNLIELVSQDWDGIKWVNFFRSIYSYDESGNLSEQVFQDWDGIKWVNFFRFIPSFDESGNLIELVLQNWDGTKWVDSTRSRIIFSYNESGGVSELKLQEWDGTDWVDIYRDILSYDESRNLIEQVRQDWDGSNWVNNTRIICTFESITGIDGNISGTLTKFTLEQNYPNPFNPTTVISYHLSEGSDVELTIYNQLGQAVRTLVRGTQSAGGHRVQWDGRDNSGKQVVSGVYLYRLKGGSFIQTRTMLLLR